MKKIKKFFRANKIPIIIFTILIIFEFTQIYQNAIKVLWDYNGYKAYQTAEWMRVDYWEFVRELLSFDNRFRTYLMIRMTIFPISVVFVSFLYLNKKHNFIKYNIGRNNKYEKELWKDRLKFAIVPVLHYVIVLTIMVVLALSTGNNIDYKFFWEIKEGSFLYGIKDNQLLLFGFEQVITMFGTYIL